MARSNKSNGSGRAAAVDRERKILGVLLISLSLLVTIGLFQNLGGIDSVEVRRANRLISQTLLGAFGAGAWLIPLLLVAVGWNRLSGGTVLTAIRALATAVAGLLTFAVLCHSTGVVPVGSRHSAAGDLGATLFAFLDRYFGALGSTLIAVTFFVVVLIGIYDIAIPSAKAGGMLAVLRALGGRLRTSLQSFFRYLLELYEAAADWVESRIASEEEGEGAVGLLDDEEEDELPEEAESEDDDEYEYEYVDGDEEDEDGEDEEEYDEEYDEEEEPEEAIVEVDEGSGSDLPGGPPQIVKPVKAERAPTSKLLKRPLSPKGEKEYLYPPLDLLTESDGGEPSVEEAYLLEQSTKLEKRLGDFGVRAKVVEVRPGPVITRFSVEPAPGVKVQQISNLADDLALVMRAKRIRIVAPIPGEGAVGIEIPNPEPKTVWLKDILTSKAYAQSKSKLPLALGKDISGRPYCAGMEEMPHLLIAGATGAGKSVSIHSILTSLLYGVAPEEVHLLMIDPKMLEMTMYNGIPHLLTPVVTDPKEAAAVLRWAVFEMERRYKLLSRVGVRNIADYNKNLDRLRASQEVQDEGLDLIALPYMVIVIDEFADLILTAPTEIEDSVARLAQMARAVGIHLVLATQRPSVNVITGVIKANFPSRIAFQVASKIDSRTILDENGAEKLLGKGDMLFVFAGRPEIHRVHGAFITTEETFEIVTFLKEQGYTPKNRLTVILEDGPAEAGGGSDSTGLSPHEDELFDEAARIVIRSGQGSVSLLQRRLRVGYSRAARLVDLLEMAGIVGPFEGSKAREVLVDEEWLRQKELEGELSPDDEE